MKPILTNRKQTIYVVLFHLLLGALAKFVPLIFTAYYAGAVFVGLILVVKSRDKDHLAAKVAVYIMGMEILYRMSGAPLVWEFGKYACILVFAAGFLAGKRQSKLWPFAIYLLLLLPAVALTDRSEGFSDFRRMVMFNLSGPICLAAAGIYFFGRRIPKLHLWDLFRFAILPSVPLLTYLFLGPSFLEVDLKGGSNFELSGGYGPNQVCTALGYFLALLFLSLWNREPLLHHIRVDIILAVLLIFRTLLTFSRGGIFATAIAIAASFVGLFLFSFLFRQQLKTVAKVAIAFVVVAIGVFFLANLAVKGVLVDRYAGENKNPEAEKELFTMKSYFTGRDKLALDEFHTFLENWKTGVGVGMAKSYRTSKLASHSEQSRLLAEHGLLGAIALLLLVLVYPYFRITVSQPTLSRQFFFLLFTWGMMTMLHSAMRLALPAVITGLSFALVIAKTRKKNTVTIETEKGSIEWRPVKL